MKKSLLLLPALYLFFYACHKDNTDCPPDLPCATQTGENTFGCYINGKPWVAKVEPYILDPTAHPLEVSYDETDYGSFNNNYLRIVANFYSDKLEYFAIHFKPVEDTGIIKMESLIYGNIEFLSQELYSIDVTKPYEFNLSNLDLEKNIISGTFYFTAISTIDTLIITNGRFDLKYNPE